MLAAGPALGRILADPVAASRMSPPFDNAAMDGYAVATSAPDGAEGRGVVPWRPRSGRAGPRPLSALQAARIFTGAPIPVGADAVVMQEDVLRDRHDDPHRRRPKAGLNIRRAGSEMAAGVIVLGSGAAAWRARDCRLRRCRCGVGLGATGACAWPFW